MIDSHVHLNGKDLGYDREGVIARAVAAGVNEFAVVGYDLASSERAVALAEGDDRIYAIVGIHPHDARAWNAEADSALRCWSEQPRVIGIGEIGLDFYRDLSPRPLQYEAFRAQLRLAEEVGLPIVIHCRDAYKELLEVLAQAPPVTPLILHCFAGTMAHAQSAWECGWYLGVGGTITYKKNDDLRAVVAAMPRERILLETDAPYLSPEPLRGKFPNEPARLALVAAKVAKIRNETIAEVDRYTNENFRRAFPRSASPGSD